MRPGPLAHIKTPRSPRNQRQGNERRMRGHRSLASELVTCQRATSVQACRYREPGTAAASCLFLCNWTHHSSSQLIGRRNRCLAPRATRMCRTGSLHRYYRRSNAPDSCARYAPVPGEAPAAPASLLPAVAAGTGPAKIMSIGSAREAYAVCFASFGRSQASFAASANGIAL